MSAGVVEATREDFRDQVADGVVLVDIWGPECRPCVRLNPHVERLADEADGLDKVVKLEAPKARRLCMEMKVMSLPSFLLFRDGEEVDRVSDPNLSPDKLEDWLSGALEKVKA
jgi:thioredoxin-like negative regulator of GroEL